MNEITYDNNNKTCAIEDMCMGTVFCYKGNWYMLVDNSFQDRKYFTAVNLSTGELGSFNSSDKAEVFTGILHINCQ